MEEVKKNKDGKRRERAIMSMHTQRSFSHRSAYRIS